MNNQALFFFSYLGVFNGFILSIYFFFFRSRKQLSGYLLGALLFVLSVRIGKSVAFFFDYNLSRTYLQLGLTACFFIGPFVYFFVKAERKQLKRIPTPWLVQLVLWLFLITAIGIIYPYQYYPDLWGNYIVPVIYLQWGAYLAATVLGLMPVLKKLRKKESIPPSEKWSLIICAAISILWACYVWAYLNFTRGSYINGALWFSLFVYVVAFAMFYRKKSNDLFSPQAKKYADKKLNPADTKQVIERLIVAMEKNEIFKNPNLKLNDLATEINVSAHQLSQVLNESIQKNFTLFVNEYRINEACRLLSQNTNLSIEGIGAEVGFNSKSTFFTTFKKIKGVTPSSYQQSITPDL